MLERTTYPILEYGLGLQIATIEFARHVCGLKDATSTEFEQKTSAPVIDIMEQQKAVHKKGGSMRLGAYPCKLQSQSLVREIYGQDSISERHRHRFEVNNRFRETLKKGGLRLSGLSPDESLVEMIELPSHPWFIGVQFHPEFQSTPQKPHPLFASFVRAALEYQKVRGTPANGSKKSSGVISLKNEVKASSSSSKKIAKTVRKDPGASSLTLVR